MEKKRDKETRGKIVWYAKDDKEETNDVSVSNDFDVLRTPLSIERSLKDEYPSFAKAGSIRFTDRALSACFRSTRNSTQIFFLRFYTFVNIRTNKIS